MSLLLLGRNMLYNKEVLRNKEMLMQIPRIFKYRHHTDYYNINFNSDRIVMLLRMASCMRQTQHTCYVLCYVVICIYIYIHIHTYIHTYTNTQYVSITRAIIRYNHKNKQRKVIGRYTKITCMKNEISFLHIRSNHVLYLCKFSQYN